MNPRHPLTASCLAALTTLALAQPAPPPGDPAAAFALLREQGEHAAATTAGLAALLRAPWDHELRFAVGDSLQRAGQIEAAAEQFAALDGTPLAGAAALRLNALGASGAPVRAAQTRPPAAPETAAAPPPAAADGAAPPARSRGALRARVELPPPPAAHAAIEERFAAGDYAAAATRGLALLARERVDDGLRLKIANSLAWSGRLPAAEKQYRALFGSTVDREARIGLANAHRWQGRADLALPLYDQVLAADAAHADAREGREQALRDLAPRTFVTLGASRDSNPIERRMLSVAHRWRNAPGDTIFELEAAGDHDESTVPPVSVARRMLTGRVENLRLPLQPRLELGVRTRPDSALFGGVRLRLGALPVWVHAGRVDWGRQALSPRAAALGANRFGVEARGGGTWGELAGNADQYAVSDGNGITTASLRYTPPWRPLGPGIRPFAVVDYRTADRATPEYWSPANGHGSLSLGLSGYWAGESWDLNASGQTGWRVAGDAGNSWSVGGGGRYWLNRELALGLNLWKMSSWRDNAAYRAHAVTVNVEKLWP